jgi:hypothetical protein
MVIVVIGLVTVAASVGSWFPPGIAVGIGLIVLGAVIAFTPGKNQ